MQKFMWTLPVLAALVLSSAVRAEEDVKAELAKLRDEVKQLKADKSASRPIEGRATAVTDQKYGPDAAVKTKAGRLTLSGLVQVWYYGIQNDKLGVFGDLTPGANRGGDTNEGKDNDGFRVRRAELKFTMDINENITAVVKIDPAREATSYPNLPTATRISAPTLGLGAAPTGFSSSNFAQDVAGGSGTTNRLLQDAYILYHSFVPHHEFQIGQFKPQFGEEGIRDSAQLDFAERSILGQLGDKRDLGVAVRGYWWDTDRFQYWFGAFDGAGNYLGTSGDFQNRADDNDQKDLLYRLLVRPLWKQETWGSLEIGGGSEFGFHGESGSYRALTTGAASDPAQVDGLQRAHTDAAVRHAAWAYYAPGSYLKGFWLRGEWQYIRDTNAQNAVNMNSSTSAGAAVTFQQHSPAPMHVWGIYGSLGYKLSDSIWNDCGMPGWLRPFEFVARYEQFQNIWFMDPAYSRRTNVANTKIVTTGFNYYIKGHNAKVQFNYNWVNESDNHAFTTAAGVVSQTREVRNDNFILNFQVAW